MSRWDHALSTPSASTIALSVGNHPKRSLRQRPLTLHSPQANTALTLCTCTFSKSALQLTLMLLFPHSLTSNSLAGEHLKMKRNAQGSSFEVGAKLTYKGRDMTVTQSRLGDPPGWIRMIDLSGVLALFASLPECGLTSLTCAAILAFAFLSAPIDSASFPWQLDPQPALRHLGG